METRQEFEKRLKDIGLWGTHPVAAAILEVGVYLGDIISEGFERLARNGEK